MNRIFLIALLLLIVASSVVFSQKNKPKPKTSIPSTKPSKESDTKDEAYNAAVNTWDKYLTKCADSYYIRPCCGDGKGRICEYRFVSITTKETAADEADRLNGIERKLVSYFDGKAERCQINGGWEEWSSGVTIYVDMMKKSGHWTAGVPRYASFGIKNTKVACSDVPN